MRTTDEIRNIRQLVERFFDGSSTLDEERQLYRFFASGDVPDELAGMTDMFRAFGAVDETGDGRSIPGKPTGAENTKRPTAARIRQFMKVRRIAACIAAVTVMSAGLFLASDIYERHRLASLYGGSYMIVDGKRVDDLKKIRPQIEHALRVGEEMEDMAGNGTAVRQAEQHLLDNIGDPAERERVRQLLNI